ncbi:MAG: hypothetical protein F6K40_03725 [Okeania sp. SIO3I5]|uniref:hypothetical protein n=1 Tax=Okeania sp. SIO3I5 TaxID=2607805 RepID=UPI0013B8F627|nr:hypothetical protein [Okeania sp. SIO3I5]NEQ35457.1 hypothetical protein [Okeania sp. SIO3I5]
MGKELSFKAKLNDDDKTIDINTIEVKLEKPKDKPKDPPPGQDFVISLLLTFLGIWFIVTFLVPGGQKSINDQPSAPTSEPAPANSENNSTVRYPTNYDQLEISSKEY